MAKIFLNSLKSLFTPIFKSDQDISYLVLFVTSQCNCKCPFCFNWRNIENAKNRIPLSLPEIDFIAKQLPNLSYLTLSGGEPSLRDDIPEICDIFYKRTTVKHITIPSNAYYTEKILHDVSEILKKCPKLFLKICISLDEIGTVHDQLRGVPNLYKHVLETIKGLKEIQKRTARLSFLTNTVFTKDNQDHILEILDYIHQNLNIDYSTVVLVRGDIKDSEQSNLNIKKFVRFSRLYWKKRLNYFRFSNLNALIQYVLSFTVQEITIENYYRKKRRINCFALKNLLVIDDIGNIFSCEPLENRGKVGNLREEQFNLQKILKNRKSQDLQLKIKNKECTCTWENAFQQSLALSPQYYPKLIVNLLKVIFQKIKSLNKE